MISSRRMLCSYTVLTSPALTAPVAVQDAHELLINLLNLIGEQLEEDAKSATSDAMSSTPGRAGLQNSAHSPPAVDLQQQAGASQQQQQQPASTWLHELFEVCSKPLE